MAEREHTCATCSYNDDGLCVRMPPKVDNINAYGCWPKIRRDHWCGEHSALQGGILSSLDRDQPSAYQFLRWLNEPKREASDG